MIQKDSSPQVKSLKNKFLFLSYNLKRYPTPQIVSIYCGFDVSISTFSRIFLICTVTVAISPMDSISQISRKSSSLVYTWFGFSARKVSKSNSFVVNCFSSPFTHTRLAVLSILIFWRSQESPNPWN